MIIVLVLEFPSEYFLSGVSHVRLTAIPLQSADKTLSASFYNLSLTEISEKYIVSFMQDVIRGGTEFERPPTS